MNLTNGVDVSAKAKNGQTALSIATAAHNTDVVKMLQAAGAK